MSLQVAHNYICLHKSLFILSSLGAGGIVLSEKYLVNNKPSILINKLTFYIRNLFTYSAKYFNVYYKKSFEYSNNVIQKYKPSNEVIEIGLLTSLNAVLFYRLYKSSDTIVDIFKKSVRKLKS